MTRSVLIVDDDRINRMVLRRAVDGEGFASVEAADGAAGVRAALLGTHVLVLMDLMMPVMDGLAAIRRLRLLEAGSGRTTPVIAVTALTDAATRSACMTAGADFYLPKPLDLSALVAALRTYALPTVPAAIAAPDPQPVPDGALRPEAVIAEILAITHRLDPHRTGPEGGALRSHLVALGAHRALAALDHLRPDAGLEALRAEVRTALLAATTPCPG